MPADGYQEQLDVAIDRVLDILFAADGHAELDPLATILDRMRVRGAELDMSQLPPLMQMLLSGAL